MVQRVIFGRMDNDAYFKKLESGELDFKEVTVDKYMDVKNTLVSQFMSGVKVGISEDPVAQVTDVYDPCAFLAEATKRLPKMLDEMEDLDHYYTELILNNVPAALEQLRRAIKQDNTSARFSHYFIQVIEEK